ncbi:Homeobox Hox-B3-like protein [Hirschfeldia incana]|nr:Homeobox Hox-B3-like protein [Hirschfeldia incana]
MSLLFSQNYDNNNNNDLCRAFERGPRYREYATLRESKLRLKLEYEKILKEEEERFFFGLEKNKQTRFGFTKQDEIKVSKTNPNLRRLSSSSTLAQSVPDFSAVIRKENRRPANTNLLPPRTDRTPPQSKSRTASVFSGSVSSTRGSVSASGGEKRSKGMVNARKSYATVEDLKKISITAASAINGGGRKSIGGGGGGRRISLGGCGGGRTILGYRQT